MQGEYKRQWIIAGIVIVAAALGGYLYMEVSRQVTDDAVPGWTEQPAEGGAESVNAPRRVITAKHAYKNGAHIIAGELELPTPCHVLDTSASASADMKKVFVEFSAAQKAGEVCAQVITPARFKVNIVADKDAQFSATYNGEVVTLNLIEAGPNEDLDKFELYIKG